MAEQNKFYRLPEEGQIFGVCAGIADYFNIDPTVVRVAAVILIFITNGFALLAYFLLGILLPAKGGRVKNAATTARSGGKDFLADLNSGDKLRNYLGLALILFGGWLLFSQFFPELFDLSWSLIWPLVIIGLGVWTLFSKKGKN